LLCYHRFREGIESHAVTIGSYKPYHRPGYPHPSEVTHRLRDQLIRIQQRNFRHSTIAPVEQSGPSNRNKRWVILVLPSKFDMGLQARIPAALAALHNFILDRDPTQTHVNRDVYDPSPGEHLNPEELLQSQGTTADTRLTEEESEEGRQIRDSIAQAMWEQYQETLSDRDIGVDEDLVITEDEAMGENEDEMDIGSDNGSDD
jgi:hypothetical protein